MPVPAEDPLAGPEPVAGPASEPGSVPPAEPDMEPAETPPAPLRAPVRRARTVRPHAVEPAAEPGPDEPDHDGELLPGGPVVDHEEASTDRPDGVEAWRGAVPAAARDLAAPPAAGTPLPRR